MLFSQSLTQESYIYNANIYEDSWNKSEKIVYSSHMRFHFLQVNLSLRNIYISSSTLALLRIDRFADSTEWI